VRGRRIHGARTSWYDNKTVMLPLPVAFRSPPVVRRLAFAAASTGLPGHPIIAAYTLSY
jgi:hypothetical protein